MSDKQKFVIYDRSETVLESIASDGATLVVTLFCIWFAKVMGGGIWEAITVVMFILWGMAKMPWEAATRTTKLRTKAEAMAWANSLPEDA